MMECKEIVNNVKINDEVPLYKMAKAISVHISANV